MMRYVCFRNSFAYVSAPNITHLVKPDGSATLCGRRGWETHEGEYEQGARRCCATPRRGARE